MRPFLLLSDSQFVEPLDSLLAPFLPNLLLSIPFYELGQPSFWELASSYKACIKSGETKAGFERVTRAKSRNVLACLYPYTAFRVVVYTHTRHKMASRANL